MRQADRLKAELWLKLANKLKNWRNKMQSCSLIPKNLQEYNYNFESSKYTPKIRIRRYLLIRSAQLPTMFPIIASLDQKRHCSIRWNITIGILRKLIHSQSSRKHTILKMLMTLLLVIFCRLKSKATKRRFGLLSQDNAQTEVQV